MFYVGQEVVCIDDRDNYWTERWVTKGEKYVVAAMHPYTPDKVGRLFTGLDYVVLDLVGVAKPHGFASVRFRPIQKKKTGLVILESLLNPANHKILEDA